MVKSKAPKKRNAIAPEQEPSMRSEEVEDDKKGSKKDPKKGRSEPAKPKGFTPKTQLDRLGKNDDPMQKLNDELMYVHEMCPKFDKFMDPANSSRNRFQNLICYDHSRLILDDDWTKKHGDYIHASLVDGYDRAAQYILCQAPFNPTTEFDFWRLVWSYAPSVIVLLTAPTANPTSNFWAGSKQEKSFDDGVFRVRTESSQTGVDCDLHEFSLTKAGDKIAFTVKMLHVTGWKEDDEVPPALSSLQAKVRMAAHQVETLPDRADAPMLFVCATGVHRSGTFVALDISIKRMQDTRRVALKQTIEQLRYERYGAVQMLNHYLFLVEAIVSAAMQAAYVHPDDVGAGVIMFTLRKTEPAPEKEKN